MSYLLLIIFAFRKALFNHHKFTYSYIHLIQPFFLLLILSTISNGFRRCITLQRK